VLAAQHRLTASADFTAAVRRGVRAGGPLLVAHFVPGGPTPDQDSAPVPPRVGLVVSGAVGPAVTRTLVKRRLRHLAREQLDVLPGGSLLVLRAQPGAAGASYAELGAELTRCLSTCLRKAAR
jgi:ribonuclease P protein component